MVLYQGLFQLFSQLAVSFLLLVSLVTLISLLSLLLLFIKMLTTVDFFDQFIQQVLPFSLCFYTCISDVVFTTVLMCSLKFGIWVLLSTCFLQELLFLVMFYLEGRCLIGLLQLLPTFYPLFLILVSLLQSGCEEVLQLETLLLLDSSPCIIFFHFQSLFLFVFTCSIFIYTEGLTLQVSLLILIRSLFITTILLRILLFICYSFSCLQFLC